jgi:hypothetical protein
VSGSIFIDRSAITSSFLSVFDISANLRNVEAK